MSDTAFKHKLGPEAVKQIADAVEAAWPALPRAALLAHALAPLDGLELMARVVHIAESLALYLPDDFEAARDVLLAALGEPAPVEAPEAATRLPVGGVRGFATLPLTRWVALAGVDHPEAALAGLEEMTKRFSAEFDVRPFIEAHPEITWVTIQRWTADPDAHVRRLASEGTRPYLPWGKRVRALIDDPEPGLAILHTLRADPSVYVRRSVANHLNDVARHRPDRALEMAGVWLSEAIPEVERSDRQRMVRHGLRGLLKKADPGALALMGYDPESPVTLTDLHGASAVTLGERLAWGFTLSNPTAEDALIRVDYVLHRPLASGKISTRVCHVAERTLRAGAEAAYDLNHSFKAVSTRTDYPGAYRIEARINGKVRGEISFEVSA